MTNEQKPKIYLLALKKERIQGIEKALGNDYEICVDDDLSQFGTGSQWGAILYDRPNHHDFDGHSEFWERKVRILKEAWIILVNWGYDDSRYPKVRQKICQISPDEFGFDQGLAQDTGYHHLKRPFTDDQLAEKVREIINQ